MLLARLDIDYEIIILTECWLYDNSPLPKLKNYECTASTRNYNQNDGIVVYTKERSLWQTSEPTESIEANCLLTTLGSEFAIVAIYRPSSFKKTEIFVNELNKLLTKLKTFRNIIIMGDQNIDIKDGNQDSRSSDYLDMLTLNGLLPAHTIPTRFNNCIDHCFVKTKHSTSTIVCDTTTTDHSCVMISLSKYPVQNSTKRYKKKIDYVATIKELEKFNWDVVLLDKNCNTATNIFLSILTRALDKYTLYVTNSHRKNIIKPWITPGLIRCMRNRDNLHLKLKKDSNNAILKISSPLCILF